MNKSFKKQRKENIVNESLIKSRDYFYKNAMDVMGLTIVSLAKISGVSRQTLYNILKGETNPDIDTLIKIAHALNVDISILILLHNSQQEIQKSIGYQEKTRQRNLIEKILEIAATMNMTAKDIMESLIYLRKSWLFRYRKHETTDYSSFICDVNYPDDSIVYTSQIFTKKWAIQNSGPDKWVGRNLICIDKKPETSFDRKDGYALAENNRLVPLQREVPIPDTLPGEPVVIAAQFQAPLLPCTAFSYWKMYDKDGNQCLPDQIGVWCRVIVINM